MHPTTPSLCVEKPEGTLYIVTERHFEFDQAPLEELMEMVERVPQAQVLIRLGDLFKVWLAMSEIAGRDAPRGRSHRITDRVMPCVNGGCRNVVVVAR
jgi:hypothetical protein